MIERECSHAGFVFAKEWLHFKLTFFQRTINLIGTVGYLSHKLNEKKNIYIYGF